MPHELRELSGSVCAPRGFRAGAVAAGIKPSGNADVAIIASEAPATVAAVFTQNQVCAAPVIVSREHAADGRARAIAVNAGNANCSTGEQGLADARRVAALTGELLGIPASEVLVASTGVIGHHLPLERLEAGLRAAAERLSPEGGPDAARAIMTTDTRAKEIAVEVAIDGRPVRVGGICKGSGMIEPNMATMLAFLTTDAAIGAAALQDALRHAAALTFNAVTVDGDTSTNDTLLILANGASGVSADAGPAREAFQRALTHVCAYLARELARDGEGATKLVTVRVAGAARDADAMRVAKTIANSPLVKTACFGNDPNWGRVFMAAGRAGVPFDQRRLSLRIAGHEVARDGAAVAYDAAAASEAMQQPEMEIALDLGSGEGAATVWTCDFSYDYVRINAEYTT